jgi:hypothetical protein
MISPSGCRSVRRVCCALIPRHLKRWIASYTAIVLSSHPSTLVQRVEGVITIALNYCPERSSRQSSSKRVSPNDSRSCQVVEGARKTPQYLTEQRPYCLFTPPLLERCWVLSRVLSEIGGLLNRVGKQGEGRKGKIE